jgi:FMN-dependent NADH-azoreductase
MFMPTLLHVDSSPRAASISTRLSAEFVEKWKRHHPDGRVIHHNTSLEKLPYLDEGLAEAIFTRAVLLTAEQKQRLELSDQLVDELIAADLLVFGVPMWNLGIPASLKAWIDLIVREGRTFKFTSTGVETMLPAGKKAYIFTARGGSYPENSPLKKFDHQESYLRAILGFLGVEEIHFIHAEHQTQGGDAARDSIQKAEEELAALCI